MTDETYDPPTWADKQSYDAGYDNGIAVGERRAAATAPASPLHDYTGFCCDFPPDEYNVHTRPAPDDQLPSTCSRCGEFIDPGGQSCTATGNRRPCTPASPDEPSTDPDLDPLRDEVNQLHDRFDDYTWLRLHRAIDRFAIEREARAASASVPPLDAKQLARAVIENVGWDEDGNDDGHMCRYCTYILPAHAPDCVTRIARRYAAETPEQDR